MIKFRDAVKLLPLENSLVAFDIILYVMANEKSLIQPKDLFENVKYSYTAVRSHYMRFLEQGYLQQVSHPNSKDLRIKILIPTPKLKNLFNSILG
jgi:DNA-binding MarR family transcriptional regulator